MLPGPIAARLKEDKGTIADGVNVTAIFIDMVCVFAFFFLSRFLSPSAQLTMSDKKQPLQVGFTSMSSGMQPADLVKLLDDVFVMMDRVAEKHNVDKIKTIGAHSHSLQPLFLRPSAWTSKKKRKRAHKNT